MDILTQLTEDQVDLFLPVRAPDPDRYLRNHLHRKPPVMEIAISTCDPPRSRMVAMSVSSKPGGGRTTCTGRWSMPANATTSRVA